MDKMKYSLEYLLVMLVFAVVDNAFNFKLAYELGKRWFVIFKSFFYYNLKNNVLEQQFSLKRVHKKHFIWLFIIIKVVAWVIH